MTTANMYSHLATLLILITQAISIGTSTELESPKSKQIIGIVALRNLLDVFLETTESHKFRVYIIECIQSYALVEVDPKQWGRDPIEADRDGNIIGIHLYNQRLTNSAIGDLSKLPSTLKMLFLVGNSLTELNVAALPRGLEILYLVRNELTELSFTKLPPSLISLFLNGNKLSSVNLSELPLTLRDLWLSSNGLTAVDLSALPPSLRSIGLESNHLVTLNLNKAPRSVAFIFLEGNHLNDSVFNGTPEDGRATSHWAGEPKADAFRRK